MTDLNNSNVIAPVRNRNPDRIFIFWRYRLFSESCRYAVYHLGNLMPISFSCPSCSSKLSAPDEASGRTKKCPKCRNEIVVPGIQKSLDHTLSVASPQSDNPGDATPPENQLPPQLPQLQVRDGQDADASSELPKSARKWIRTPLLLVFGGGAAIFLVALAAIPVILVQERKVEVTNAIAALGRVEAAVEVGVNFQQYTQLVIEAKATVNDAERILRDGELSTNLKEAMNAYIDVATIWNYKIQFSNIGKYIKTEYGHGRIISTYNLHLSDDKDIPTDAAMQVIWGVASQKLAKARSIQ